MREIYDILEKMVMQEKLELSIIISELTDNIVVRRSVVSHKGTGDVLRGKNNMGASYTFVRDGRLMIQRFPGFSEENIDIGDGITVSTRQSEFLYDFLIRNNILRPEHIPVLEKLVLEYT